MQKPTGILNAIFILTGYLDAEFTPTVFRTVFTSRSGLVPPAELLEQLRVFFFPGLDPANKRRSLVCL